jgi:hypothetical protein
VRDGDLARSYECLVAERALLDALVQVADRQLAIIRRREAGQGR